MPNVAAITGLTVAHSHSATDEPRDNDGILTGAVLHYSWTNNSLTYSKIVVTYTKWDPIKKKWDPKATLELPGISTSWDYDILDDEDPWTPNSGKFTSNIKASFTAYETFDDKVQKSKSVSVTFKFTAVGKILLPILNFEYLDQVVPEEEEELIPVGEERFKYIWTLDETALSEADKKTYNNTIVYRSKWQMNELDPGVAKDVATAFNKKNYPVQEFNYNGVSGESDICIPSGRGKYKWFRLYYDTLAGTSSKYNSILIDSSGPLAPVIDKKKSKLKLAMATLVYKIQANKNHAVSVVDVERCFGTPSACTSDHTLEGLSLPENPEWVYVKSINPTNKYKDTNRTDNVQLMDAPRPDQVAWLRLCAKNGDTKIYSNVVCIGGSRLSTPIVESVVPNPQTLTVAVSVENTSAFPVDGVKIAVLESNGANTFTLWNLSQDDLDENTGRWKRTIPYKPAAAPEEGSSTTSDAKVEFAFVAFFGDKYGKSVLQSDQTQWYEDTNTKTTPLTDVKVHPSEAVPGSLTVEWVTSWAGADGVEISWADHKDAWQSNEGPSTATYQYAETPYVEGQDVESQKSSFNIRGLKAGNWYIRVRATKGEGSLYSAYADASEFPYNYASDPGISALDADPKQISKDPTSSFKVSWAYSNSDNSTQKSATIYELIPKQNDPDDYDKVEIDNVKGEDTSLTISPWAPDEEGGAIEGIVNDISVKPCFRSWGNGTSHILVVQTVSSMDISSPDPVESYKEDKKIGCEITINEPPIKPDLDPLSDSDIFALGFNNGEIVEMPLFIKLADFSDRDDIVNSTDSLKLSITRIKDISSPNRPDGSDNDGFEGETIFSTYMMGSNLVVYTDPDTNDVYTGGVLIKNSDLVGHLDDGCMYDISLTITNSNKLSTTANVAKIDGDDVDGGIYVNWNRQAATPSGLDIQRYDVVDEDGNPTGDVNLILTPVPSPNVDSESVFDIYRLTVDKPQLIVEGGIYGESYVDPYPTIGVGYRVVDRTKNNDWIEGNVTTGGKPAWIDVYAKDKGIDISFYGLLINFGNEFLRLPFNVKLSNKWKKDFQVTRYLNGKIVGDWNAGVERTISANSNFMKEVTQDMKDVDLENIIDEDTKQRIRDLADYAGICHIRTMDGISVSADIQVNEEVQFHNDINSYSLDISIVEPEELDGYKGE